MKGESTLNSPNAILHELLNLAEIMLTNGAEVSRVEETLNRMGHAYGSAVWKKR